MTFSQLNSRGDRVVSDSGAGCDYNRLTVRPGIHTGPRGLGILRVDGWQCPSQTACLIMQPKPVGWRTTRKVRDRGAQ
jgi:hypothetical protein